MGLLIWLPLHGNLNNYGSLPITFSLNTSGGGVAAASTGGKTDASCYQRTTINTASHITSSSTVNLDKDFTMACWCYPTTAGAETSANGVLTNHNHSYNSDKGSGSGITLKYNGATTCYMSCNTSTSSGRTFHTYYGTTNIYGAWHHLCLTYKKASKTYRLYVDGICEKEFTCDNTAQPNKFNIFDWSTGHSTSGSYRPLCRVNDVRVYDHCLSKKEVKLLSQGLVAHYKLDCGGANNLLTNTSNPLDKTGSVNSSYGSVVYDDTLGLNVFQSSTTATGETYLYSSRTPVVSKSTQYTFSCDLYANDLVKSIDVFWLSDTDATQKTGSGYVNVTSKSHTPTLRNGWYHYTWTFTTKADDRTGYIRIDNNGSSTEGSAAILKAANLKLEKGSKETGYSRSMSEIHFSPADDCSGYNRNGVASGTFNLDTDTPRYSTSSIFSGSNYITATHSMDGTNATISAWVKVSSYPTANSIILADKATNIALSFYGNNSILSCGDGNNTTRTVTNLKAKWDTAKWNHMVVVKKGSTYTFYLNGVEWTAQGGAYGSTNYWTHTPANELLISGRHNGSTHEHKFTGNISDVRIYCSALSAEDIKILYETAGSVTKEGGLIAYEFQEQLDSLAKMKKTGVFMAEDFSERGKLANMKFTTLADGSAWARIFYHANHGGTVFFTSLAETLNSDTPDKFSCLYLLDELKATDGKYEFMLTYPEKHPGKYNRWKQTNNPCNENVANGDGTAYAAGYAAVHIDWASNYWGGLTRQNASATAYTPCYLSGSVGHSNWFYAIGATQKHDGGIPGPSGGVQETELWVRVDTLPKNSKFNIMKEQFVSGTLFQEI